MSFRPGYWRSYTVIGSAGRLENFGDGPGATIRIWRTRADRYREEPDQAIVVPDGETTGHGGADPLLIAEFLRFARHGGPTMTSPVAARQAVAAGVAATTSVREGGHLVAVPPLDPTLVQYFDERRPA